MTQVPSPQAAPGWYPQPDGSMRYWNGTQWTSDVAVPLRPTPRPPRRYGWAIALVVLAGAFALVVIVAVAFVATDSVIVEPAPSDRALYSEVTPRELAQVVKDPDAHSGELVIIYGEVTQLDSATGSDNMLADISAQPLGRWGFGDNAYLSAPEPDVFAEIVEGDRIRAWVEVEGSYSYDTQIGGGTTVPRFVVADVEVTMPATD